MGDDVEQGGNGSITNMGLMFLCNNTSTDIVPYLFGSTNTFWTLCHLTGNDS